MKKEEQIVREKAILIKKHISTKKTAQEDAVSLAKMRVGIFDDFRNQDIRKHFLEFMTSKGPISFMVSSAIYHPLKIDSLGILSYRRFNYVGFDFIKIATSADVQTLGW